MNEVVNLNFLKKIIDSPVISPIIIVDDNGVIIYLNKKVLDIYGDKESESYIGKSINDYINVTKINEIKLNDSRRVKFYVDMKDKGELSLHSKVSKIKIQDKNYYIITIEDIDREIEQYDPLTNLYNRHYFKMKLKKIIKIYNEENLKLAILMIKIQKVKKINERYGYQIGDRVLKKIAIRLKNNIKDDDVVARLGGSEFCVILTDLKNYTDSGVIANQIYSDSKKALDINEYKIKYSIKIGIATFPDTSRDYNELMKNAYFALQNSQEEETCNFYSKKLEQDYNNKIEFENKLLDAITNKELYLVYHPQVNLINNKIIGVEALLRWDYAIENNISTEELITIAEESEISINPVFNASFARLKAPCFVSSSLIG